VRVTTSTDDTDLGEVSASKASLFLTSTHFARRAGFGHAARISCTVGGELQVLTMFAEFCSLLCLSSRR